MKNKMHYYKSVARMLWHSLGFSGSADYWQSRYVKGGNSGEGSYGDLAAFKAEFLNNFVRENNVESILEFGCGDGNQLKLAVYPSYTGVDVSRHAIDACRRDFDGDSTKEFFESKAFDGRTADAVVSLDVIYHLVEDGVFESYMNQLFDASRRFVIIYSSNSSEMFSTSPHVRHRNFTPWIEQNKREWCLAGVTANRYPTGLRDQGTSFAHFFVYTLKQGA